MGSPADRPEQIGPYRILHTLGEGGMGTVFVAEQTAPVKRKVALKLIKLGMDSKAVVARFEQERQALALMQHDGIAKVFDCGTSDRGQPYFVMEFVKGVPLTEYCDRHRLSLPERIWMMQQVCDAVQHAHHKGVVHRDLKPGNVLVAEDSGKRQIKIIDFGLAKAMSQRLVEATLFTEIGQVIGTPEYMAPEQADPSNQDIDTRADVYSLGVMLYEVLAGVLPFTDRQLRQAGLLEMQRVLKEVEPQKPSTKLSAGGSAAAVAEQRRTSAAALHKALKNDLDWLVLKAIEKDRARRYETANGLKMDLQRYLDHEPLVAGPPSAGYRLKKLVRRYRGHVLAGSFVLLALVGGGVSTFVQYLRAEDQKLRAQENEQRANENAFAAQENLRRATAEEERANAKVREFDQLAVAVLYERAIAREAELWPPWPDKVEAMEAWLRDDAGRLLATQDGIDKAVRDLRARALPATAEEVEKDRRSHPRYGEYEVAVQVAESLRYAQQIRAGKPLIEPSLTAEQQALDGKALSRLAAERVAPPQTDERRVWGEEALGLALARLAAEKAKGTSDDFRSQAILAWALVATGQDMAAKAASERALSLAPEDDARQYEQNARDVAVAAQAAGETLAAAEARVSELAAVVGKRRTWSFVSFTATDEAQRFLHDTLVELQGKLSSLASKQKVAVEQRLVWAKQIRELTLAHPNAKHTWAAVRAAVASNPKYAGQSIDLRDEDVLGLVPIGENTVTHLWEFYELRSAWDGRQDPRSLEIPQHEANGSIGVTGESGIVFVLLPGGTFWMGAQKNDSTGTNFDHDAHNHERPVHQVTLAPFFLARHELTRGQWQRLTGTRPFLWDEGRYSHGDRIAIGPSHPADSMDWEDASRWMERYGLLLPTEAQWEYGCRAGTSTPWWPGPGVADLQGCANVHDQTSVQRVPDWGVPAPFADGFTGTAPVGSFRANTFGLHDVHGSVWEWCRDVYGTYTCSVRAGDGYRMVGSSSDRRVLRGGSFYFVPVLARSSHRDYYALSFRNGALGLRPSRKLRL